MSSEKRWPCHYCQAKLLPSEGHYQTTRDPLLAVWACHHHDKERDR